MMKKYLQAKKVWDSLSANARRKLLAQHGRDQLLSCRSYPYLPQQVRADIQPGLLKDTPTPSAPKQPKHYWYQEI